ncbi:MAG: hypothetical protein EOP84_01740 [Verrucomicrobiaceae bacterium]|nr:MAG: hypothetical protein EOP84_01740 [Verrucomicrobiaceae bacterium]
MTEYIKFPLLGGYVETKSPYQPSVRFPTHRGINIHALKGQHNREIHDAVKATLWPEFVEWLDQNTPGVQISWLELIFRDPREAFAFKMRWGGIDTVKEFSRE